MNEINLPELVWSVATFEFENILGLIELIDNKIRKEANQRGKDIKAFQEKHNYHNTNDYDLIEDHLMQKYIISIKDYPNIVYQSILISGYSLLEIKLNELCQLYKKIYHEKIKLNLNDINGKGIERAIKYLEKVIGYSDLKKNEYWEKIVLWKDVRNAIVHNDGYIYDKNKIDAIKKKLNIKFDKCYLRGHDNDKIKECISYISIKSCKKAISCFVNYLQWICKIPEIRF